MKCCVFCACGELDDTWVEVRCVCRGGGMDLDRSDEGDRGGVWMGM